MRVLDWNTLRGPAMQGEVELRELVGSTPRWALFSGQDLVDPAAGALFIQIFDANETEAEQILTRFQEAAFFRQSNLVRVYKTWHDAPNSFVYIASEAAEVTLSQFARKRPISVEDARELTSQLVSSLSYLHYENMVFCNLRPPAIWRIDGIWKLADFSQLRLIGTSDPKELRIALARQTDLPPEVYQGIVSPAWDTWALGALLRNLMVPELNQVAGPASARARQMREVQLPPPFDSITRDCLEPDPDRRITLADIRSRLEAPPEEMQGEPVYGHPGLEPYPSEAPSNPVAGLWFRLSHARPAQSVLWALGIAGVLLGLIFGMEFFMQGGTKTAAARKPVAAATAPANSEADRATASIPPPAPLPDRGKASPFATDDNSIKAMLEKWSASTRKRDLAEQIACYAPLVNVFYNQRHVSREDVQRMKRQQYESIGTVHRFDLNNIYIARVGADGAIVTFDKHWDFGDRGSKFAGAERAQLTLRMIDGAWKIVAEREMKVYWVRKPPGMKEPS